MSHPLHARRLKGGSVGASPAGISAVCHRPKASISRRQGRISTLDCKEMVAVGSIRDSIQVAMTMTLDAGQLAKLIETHAGRLRLWIRGRCASPEDVVQEAFCRLAVQARPPDNSVAWLYRVCRNLAERQRNADERRRGREQSRASWEITTVEFPDPLEVAEMMAAVEQLAEELREVLIARVWGQLSLEEIGRLCGISTATACRRYEAALQSLRTKLELKCENRP